MTRIASAIARNARAPMLVAVGIVLLGCTWLVAGLNRSDATGAKPIAPSAEMLVVGFGHVDVEGGLVPLSPGVPGKIERVSVIEGEKVKAGQPLIVLDSNQAEAQLIEAEAAVEQATIQRRQAARSAESHSLRRKLQEQAILAARNRLEAQERDVQQVERLAGDSVVPNERLLVSRDIAGNLRANLEAEELRLQQLNLENPSDAVELADSALRQAKAKLEQARDLLHRQTLTAPSDGTVLRISVAVGQTTSPGFGAPALWFAPDKPRVVRCEFDQAFADRIAAGAQAEIFDNDGKGTVLTGVVSTVGPWIAPKRSVLDEPFLKNDVRTLECIITVDPTDAELRIGQRMRVVLSNSLAESHSQQ